MRERVQELKACSPGEEDSEGAVLAKIGAMAAADRALGERLHAIIKASAPVLSPKTRHGMPAFAKDGQVDCFLPKRGKVQSEIRCARFGD